MSYQIIPNFIFLFSVLGILLIVLKHLPEAAAQRQREAAQPSASEKLAAKGLPAEALSKIRSGLRFWVKKTWIFILEAKDLKPHSSAGYRMKKIFNRSATEQKKPAAQPPLTTHEVKNEQYYLDIIKLQPKNLLHYDALGKFYLDQENFSDAKDVYLYLAGHEPANPDFQARLAYCYYCTKNYAKAVEHYQKSLGLDSTQPNRYYNLGLSLDSAGEHQKAVNSFRQAISLEHRNIKYHLSLAHALMKIGEKQQAKEALLEARKIDPENQAIKEKLNKYA